MRLGYKHLLAALLSGACVCCPVTQVFAGQVPVDTFFTSKLNFSPRLSPDGAYLAVITSETENQARNRLAVYDLKTGKLWRAFSIVNARKLSTELFWRIHWVSDGRIVAESEKDVGGTGPVPTGKIYTVNLKQNYIKLLQGPREYGNCRAASCLSIHASYYNAASYRVLRWLRGDPNHFISTDYFNPPSPYYHQIVQRSPAAFLLSVKDVASTTAASNWSQGVNLNGYQLMTSPLPNGRLMADYQGRIRIAIGFNKSSGKPEWVYRDTEADAWVPMPSRLLSGFGAGPIDFMPGNKGIYLLEYAKDTGTLGLYAYYPDTGQEKLIYDNPHYDIQSLVRGHKGEKIIGVRLMPGKPKTVLFNHTDPVAKTLDVFRKRYGGEVSRVVSTDRNGMLEIVEVSSDRNPGAYYLFKLKTGKIRPLFKKHPGVDAKDMVSMRAIQFKARDGRTIHGYLTLPYGAGQSDLPMIVYVHGGPFDIRAKWRFNPLVQLLANRGYAVLQVNFRGSSGYGWPFIQAGFKHWGTTMQYDVIDGTRWAIRQGYADPKRICIYGASYGGYAALRSAELAPNLYRCTVGYDGVYDLSQLYRSGDIRMSGAGRHYLDLVLGHDKSALEEQSPVSHVERLSGGILLVEGGQDERAPARQTNELRRRLKAAGKHYEYLYRYKEAHGFHGVKDQRVLAHTLLRFFARYTGSAQGAK